MVPSTRCRDRVRDYQEAPLPMAAARGSRNGASGSSSEGGPRLHREVDRNEEVGREQVIFARFVDHTEHRVLLRIRVVDDPVGRATLQGRAIGAVADADRVSVS
jgi:hypothetical protein